MNLGVPLACYDNGFNNNTTFGKAFYFKDVDSLKAIINNCSSEQMQNVAKDMKDLVDEHYTWKKIAEKYYDYFRHINKRIQNTGKKVNFYERYSFSRW